MQIYKQIKKIYIEQKIARHQIQINKLTAKNGHLSIDKNVQELEKEKSVLITEYNKL